MKILISRPDKIGDVVLALHGAKQLKKYIPNCKIYMHVADYTRDLVENVKFIDQCISKEEEAKDYKFDAFVDLMAKHRTSKLFKELKVPIRIGNSARWFRFNYNRRAYIRRSKAVLNEAEYNWRLLRLIHPSLKNTNLNEDLQFSDFKNITDFPELNNHIVLMPGIAVSARGWSKENWLDLANDLSAKEPSKKILIILGPAEEKLESFYTEQTKDSPMIEVRKPRGYEDLLGCLKNASNYVGLSSGVTHLASCMRIPGIALYPEAQSMHPSRWLPFNSSVKVMSLDRNPSPKILADALIAEHIPKEYNPLHQQPLSAFVISCNEEKNIARCLNSLKWCDEILVVDSGSTDKTVEIAKKIATTVVHRDWPGHREQKHYALKSCKNEWVLSLDSDEEVSMELKGKILEILRKPTKQLNKYKGFDISRIVYYLDTWWDKGGWYPEYRTRLLHRDSTNWGGVNPHDKAVVNGKVKKIKQPLYHFTYENTSHQIECLSKHSSSSAKYLFDLGKRARIYNIFLNPIFRFFKFYILKLGFRHGFKGLIVAFLEASYTYFKYVKLWELGRAEGKNKDRYLDLVVSNEDKLDSNYVDEGSSGNIGTDTREVVL